MKQYINKQLCKWFGHKPFSERYAKRQYYSKYYSVIESEKCLRYGKELRSKSSWLMSRAELLKGGWFIEE